MSITVKHSKVSTIPDGDDSSLIRPSDWNSDHTLTGLGTMAEQNANAVAITGGTMSGVAITGYIPSTEKGVANGVATLDSGGTVPLSQLPPLGDLNYQGAWNASTNTPTLTSSVGTKGYYYVVSVAGTTNLNGITDWQVGDWAVFNGSVWQKIDNTDAVTSVNGYTGTVVLTAADVGAVPYTGATTAVDLNAKTLTNIAHLGLNSTAVPDILLRAYGDNNSTSRIAIRGYSSNASSSSMRIAKFRGTYAAPQAPLSGDSLGKFELAGYGTTSANGYPQASYEGVATENWGATARGAKALFYVTPNTTITQAVALTIDQDSKATFANTVTANGVLLTGNTGTVTSVATTAGTGISVSGSPITTSGTLTITNTAPDQTVAFTNGTGISVTGTYPNFTVTNTAPSSGGTVTSVTGTAPVVSSGGTTPAISMAAANTTTNGYLTSTDWNTFNGKGSGSVTSVAQSFTGGLISVAGSPITTSGTLALTVAGTSGGIPYFSSATTWATSAALAANALMVGGGAGVAPSTITTGTGVNTALGVNTGTAGAFVVNGGVLGTPSSGTVTNLTGTASININGTVGATTASTGAFTTLSASSTVSGTGFSTYLASPPAIGGTAAAAITGTTITATKFVGVSGGTF